MTSNPGNRTSVTTHCDVTAGNAQHPGHTRTIADELALRAGADPAWDAVLAVYLDGAALFPHPFTAR
jgi:hypothetical protein